MAARYSLLEMQQTDQAYLYRANVFDPHKNVTITAVIAMIE